MNSHSEITIEEFTGEVHVFLNQTDDDHIVVKFSVDSNVFYEETIIPHGTFA